MNANEANIKSKTARESKNKSMNILNINSHINKIDGLIDTATSEGLFEVTITTNIINDLNCTIISLLRQHYSPLGYTIYDNNWLHNPRNEIIITWIGA